MSTKNMQPIETNAITTEIRKSIHAQFFDLGQQPREIGRRYGLKDSEVCDIAREMQRMVVARSNHIAFVNGRRSLLVSYAQKAGMN